MKMKCPYCGKQAKFSPNEEFYGKRYGKSYMCYYCKPCNAYVGTHNNTDQPLGTMANQDLRNWRKKAHRTIDPLWKSGKMKRNEMYELLTKEFGYKIHIGSADIATCKKVIKFIKGLNEQF